MLLYGTSLARQVELAALDLLELLDELLARGGNAETREGIADHQIEGSLIGLLENPLVDAAREVELRGMMSE